MIFTGKRNCKRYILAHGFTVQLLFIQPTHPFYLNIINFVDASKNKQIDVTALSISNAIRPCLSLVFVFVYFYEEFVTFHRFI